MKSKAPIYRNRVAVVTGGLLNVNEKSISKALLKQFYQIRASNNHWLESKIKLVSAEPILLSKLTSKSKTVRAYLDNGKREFPVPELTEVVLIDELSKLGIEFEVLTYDDLFSDLSKVNRILASVEMVFASTTLLHDLSELMPLLEKLKKPHIHLVLGGALTGSLYKHWAGDELVEVMAVGYGEFLIPLLVDWMKSGFRAMDAPARGRKIQQGPTLIVFSGTPESKELDFLSTPDWKVPESYHGRKFKKIFYESVRGCPYRCNFCNYPFLFDDTKFRYKSAGRMAEDWKIYYQNGVQNIVCLDSLFTMPKRRLLEFCELLLKDKTELKWTCYARADDLITDETVALMKASGARQLQIGIESGSQKLLDAMNKKCTVENNLKAIQLCRKHGITSLISLIVGFPGETAGTLQETFEFMETARPDFHFLATFSVRVEEVPMLSPENRARFSLQTMSNPNTFAPYWNHHTMNCKEVGDRVRQFGKALALKKISLDGSVFYPGIDGYQFGMRPGLLEFQSRMYEKNRLVQAGMDRIHKWLDRELGKDVDRWLYNEIVDYDN